MAGAWFIHWPVRPVWPVRGLYGPPGSGMARERKGQGASWPGSESARVLLADSLPGAKWPGSEKTRYCGLYGPIYAAACGQR